MPGLCVQAKEVIPDPELMRKFNWTRSPEDSCSAPASSLELTYITDFFLALAICNSVVVSSPRHRQDAVSRRLCRMLFCTTMSLQTVGNRSTRAERLEQTV